MQFRYQCPHRGGPSTIVGLGIGTSDDYGISQGSCSGGFAVSPKNGLDLVNVRVIGNGSSLTMSDAYSGTLGTVNGFPKASGTQFDGSIALAVRGVHRSGEIWLLPGAPGEFIQAYFFPP